MGCIADKEQPADHSYNSYNDNISTQHPPLTLRRKRFPQNPNYQLSVKNTRIEHSIKPTTVELIGRGHVGDCFKCTFHNPSQYSDSIQSQITNDSGYSWDNAISDESSQESRRKSHKVLKSIPIDRIYIEQLELNTVLPSLISFKNDKSSNHICLPSMVHIPPPGGFLLILSDYIESSISIASRCDEYANLVFPEKDASLIFKQILKGVNWMHEEYFILHRNLSIHQILLDELCVVDNTIEHCVVKITDFEFAAPMNSKHSSTWKSSESQKFTSYRYVPYDLCVTKSWPRSWIFGNPHIVSPEVFMRLEWSTGSEAWALGVLLYEMLYGAVPFLSRYRTDLAKQIRDCKVPIGPDEVSPGAADLMTSLICKDEIQRIDIIHKLVNNPPTWLQDPSTEIDEWVKGNPQHRSGRLRRMSTAISSTLSPSQRKSSRSYVELMAPSSEDESSDSS